MGLFNRAKPAKVETRAGETISEEGVISERSFDFMVLRSLEAGGTTLSKDEALNIPALAACVEFVSGLIASLPVKLYRDNDGKVEEIRNDYRLALLNDETGDLLDGNQFKKALITDYLLTGKAYAFVNRMGHMIESLHYVESGQISIMKNTDPIFKEARFTIGGKPYYDWEFLRMTRKTTDGVTGTGILAENPMLFLMMYNSLLLENTTAKSGNKKGFLQSAKPLSQEQMDILKEKWKAMYGGSEESVIVLNEGLTFVPASNTAQDMQVNENKQTNSAEVCKLVGLSPKIFEGGATEDDYKNSVKYGVLPVLATFKTALNKAMLLEREKPQLYFDLDTTELMKADIQTRFNAYEVGVRSGFLQIDDVRYMEDMNPLGFNMIKLGLGDVFYNPATGEIITPNTGETKQTKATAEGGEEFEGRDTERPGGH